MAKSVRGDNETGWCYHHLSSSYISDVDGTVRVLLSRLVASPRPSLAHPSLSFPCLFVSTLSSVVSRLALPSPSSSSPSSRSSFSPCPLCPFLPFPLSLLFVCLFVSHRMVWVVHALSSVLCCVPSCLVLLFFLFLLFLFFSLVLVVVSVWWGVICCCVVCFFVCGPLGKNPREPKSRLDEVEEDVDDDVEADQFEKAAE
jgi:hypothetical protein